MLIMTIPTEEIKLFYHPNIDRALETCQDPKQGYQAQLMRQRGFRI